MNLITINNVRGFIDESGMAQLNLEDVSRGLGFTTVAASGNDVVRWSRVKEYLVDLKFLQEDAKDGLPEFIPENIFYRLSMKAKNETAENFQIKVADEILPSIRKTGSYQQPQSQLEILQSSINQLVEQEQKVKQIETQLTTVNHRLDNIDRIDTIGDLRQRLNAMVKRYAHQERLTFSTAWKKFRNAFNTAYHTNLTNRVNHYKDKHGLKSLSIPLYLSLSNNLEDAIRVADKMLNQDRKE